MVDEEPGGRGRKRDAEQAGERARGGGRKSGNRASKVQQSRRSKSVKKKEERHKVAVRGSHTLLPLTLLNYPCGPFNGSSCNYDGRVSQRAAEHSQED